MSDKKTCPKCGGEGDFQKSWYLKGKNYEVNKIRTKISLFKCRVCRKLYRKGERVQDE